MLSYLDLRLFQIKQSEKYTMKGEFMYTEYSQCL